MPETYRSPTTEEYVANDCQDAALLLCEIKHHAAVFALAIRGQQVKLSPGQVDGTRASEFTQINPLDEWMDVSSSALSDVRILQESGSITLLRLDEKLYARAVE